MVRVGILMYGVFPSSVCRRIPGIQPVMSVKARIAAIQPLKTGEVVGYGMRYTVPAPARIAVLPIGYGDGFPRVRNAGGALIRGRHAPLVGGVAMDAITVDITGIPDAQMWDEAVIMGSQGAGEITVHDMARLKNTVSYDVLTNWRLRLRRKTSTAKSSRAPWRRRRPGVNPRPAEVCQSQLLLFHETPLFRTQIQLRTLPVPLRRLGRARTRRNARRSLQRRLPPLFPQSGPFYLCRQIRVHLAAFKPSSENRRILRKGAGIQARLVPRAEFDYTRNAASSTRLTPTSNSART